MSKTTKTTAKPNVRAKATPAAELALPTTPKRRRRRRRSRSQVLAQRVLIDIRHKQRDFLRQCSAMLSDALGFEVRVALVRVKPELSPDMRRASRLTRKQARRQMADSMSAPVVPGGGRKRAAGLDDAIPF